MENILNLIKLHYNTVFSMKKYSIAMLFMIIFMPICNNSFIVFGSALIVLWLNYSLLAYEDKSKVNYLIYSLPVTTKEYILSKYIFGFINIAIAFIYSDIIYFIFDKLNRINTTEITLDILNISVVCSGLFIVIVVAPIALVVGVNKGRLALIFLALVPVCFSQNLMILIQNISSNISESMLKILMLLVGVIGTVLSYLITCNLYSKKDIE